MLRLGVEDVGRFDVEEGSGCSWRSRRTRGLTFCTTSAHNYKNNCEFCNCEFCFRAVITEEGCQLLCLAD